MLPDIRKPSGITKTVQQVNFGGIDKRDGAGDGTFYSTEGLTSDRAPLLVVRDKWRWYYDQTEKNDVIDLGFAVVVIEDGGGVYYYDPDNSGYIHLCNAAIQSPDAGFCRFGNRLILTKTKEIIDLSHPIRGVAVSAAQLPSSATEGTAYIVRPANVINGEFYVRQDGAWIDAGPVIQSLEASCAVEDVWIGNGVYQGESASMNCLLAADDINQIDFNDYFKAGDAVSIRGCQRQPKNNQTIIIREVQPKKLMFYENSFRMPGRSVFHVDDPTGFSAGTLIELEGFCPEDTAGRAFYLTNTLQQGDTMELFTETQADYAMLVITREGQELERHDLSVTGSELVYPDDVADQPKIVYMQEIDDDSDSGYREPYILTISKKLPEGIEGLFCDSNRLWGWSGNKIYASKLGDPSNFFSYDGTADDAWSVEVQTPGTFTGGISVHGYPTFFKENRRYRVYGSQPSAFQLTEQDCHGVMQGCGRSMAVVDGALYYVSLIGVMRDSGAVPELCSQALGNLRLHNAVGGGVNTKLWLSGLSQSNMRTVLNYDTRTGLWIRCGSQKIVRFEGAGFGRLLAIREVTGQQYLQLGVLCGENPWPDSNWMTEGSVSWEAVTNDYTAAQPNRKRVHRVQIRAYLDNGTSFRIQIRYDGGAWRQVRTITGDGKKKSWYIPVMLRRCDHFALRFSGTGKAVLHSLALELRTGSESF